MLLALLQVVQVDQSGIGDIANGFSGFLLESLSSDLFEGSLNVCRLPGAGHVVRNVTLLLAPVLVRVDVLLVDVRL